MSKKKNTLKDLDEFLKQQAAALVSPSKLSEKVEQLPPLPRAQADKPTAVAISAAKIFADLKKLAQEEKTQFRDNLYDLIIQSIELLNQYSPEDRMLINTALYLKNPGHWKEAIRDYWKKRNNVHS